MSEIVRCSRFSSGTSSCPSDRLVWPKGGSVGILQEERRDWRRVWLLQCVREWAIEWVSEWMSEWVIEWGTSADNMLTDWQREATAISIDPAAQTPCLGQWLLHRPSGHNQMLDYQAAWLHLRANILSDTIQSVGFWTITQYWSKLQWLLFFLEMESWDEVRISSDVLANIKTF